MKQPKEPKVLVTEFVGDHIDKNKAISNVNENGINQAECFLTLQSKIPAFSKSNYNNHCF
jgi:hypothetical protein